MPFDRAHQLAVLAILALNVDRNDGVQGRNHEKDGEDEPEKKAGHDQDDVEDGRERLAVQQEGERRNENCEQVDHGPKPLPDAPSMWDRARRRTMPGLSQAAPILLTCGMTDLRTAFDDPAAEISARALRFLYLRPCASA